jgi:DNA (cytosine-5)-methyltransferase 1
MELQFTDSLIICGLHSYDRALIEKIIEQASNSKIKHAVVDGFAGFGGVTHGFSKLSGWKVIACINHWDVAIDIHMKNNPDCLHLQEDFKKADLTIIKYMIAEILRRNPGIRIHLWLSLECTNFSNAKGGMSRDADSRTLADHADRYVYELNPDVIWIENVKEFKLWGPMIPKVCVGNGKQKKTFQFNPDNDDAIEFFQPMIDEGHHPYCPLTKNKKEKRLDPWMIPEKAKLSQDFNRWMNYICSFGYDCEHKLFNCADYGVPQHRVRLIMQFNRLGLSAKFPEPTHSKNGRNGLPLWKPVKPCLDLEDEGPSVLSFLTRKGVIVPRIKSAKTIDRLIEGIKKHILSKQNDNEETNTSYLVDHYFGNGYAKPVTEPAGTTGTKDGIALHAVQFLSTYHSVGKGSGIEAPSNAIQTKDKYPLVTAKFVMDTQFNNKAFGVEQPSRVITANRKHFYIVNFQWFSNSFMQISKPSNTIIARQDKAPNYLVTLETGELAIEVFENDPPHYVRLKEFMAENGIVSINMRMLKEKEMLRIMTISDTYHLSKSSTHNKKMIGNAVPSEFVAQLGLAYETDNDFEILKVA